MAGQGSAIGNLEIASFTFADDPLPEGQQIVIAVGREDVTGLGSARFGAVGVAGGNISYRDDGVNGPATFTADQSITDYVAFEGTYEEGATGAPTLTTPYSDQSNLITSTANIDLTTNYVNASTFTVTGLPAGLSSANGVVTGTVTAPAGVYTVTVVATNGSLGDTPQTFTWYALTAGSGSTTINSLINSSIN
jgi:hypothetical protein